MRKLFRAISVTTLAILLGSTAVTSAVAWLKIGYEVSLGNTGSVHLNAGAEAAYFGGGDGSSGNPYIISNSNHLYNLAWLQYIGYFNSPEPVKQLYFKLGDDVPATGLDMTGVVLPPIGTDTYPFLGNFDGNGKKIVNLTVSNDDPMQSTSDFGVTKPDTSILSGTTRPNIVGFFGVVGQLPSQNINYTSSTVEMKNFTLENLTIVSKTSQTLVGFAAGYVDGNVSGVKIGGNSKINLNESTTTAITDITNDLSDYGLVGYTTKKGSTGNYSQDISKYYHTGGSGSGADPLWGGSIAFDAFNQRLHHHILNSTDIRFKNGNTTYSTGLLKSYSNSDSKLSIYRGGTASAADTYLKKDPNSNYVVYNIIGAGTHSIWSGNGATTSGRTKYTAASAVDGTYQPLMVNSDYSTSSKNTGYLASDTCVQNGSSHLYNTLEGTIRSASYPNGQISNSFDDTFHAYGDLYNSSTGGPIYTYNGNKMEILTNKGVNYSDGYTLVSDDYNSSHTVANSALTGYTKTTYTSLGLKRYKDARFHLESVLSGSSYVHGIHFMGEAASASKTISVPNAIINGTSKTNYPVLLNTIDFNVAEPGYITLFAGAYFPQYATTTADHFFELYRVTRNGDSISSISKVYKIYKDSSNNYTYTTSANQTVSGATLVFDMSYLTNNPPKNNVVYYFEIPVGAGEFALGTVSGKTAGSYLLYLDIGTAAPEATDEISAYAVTTHLAGNMYPTGVDFDTTDVTTSNGGNTLGIIISAGSSGEVSFNVNGTTIGYTSDYSTQYAYSTKTVTVFGSQAPPSSPPVLAQNGTRVITAHITTIATPHDEWDIVITEELDANGNQTSRTYTTVLKNGGSVSSNAIPASFKIDTIDTAVKQIAISIARNTGNNIFEAQPSYSGVGFKTVDIVLDNTGLTLTYSNVANDHNITVKNLSGTTLYTHTASA